MMCPFLKVFAELFQKATVFSEYDFAAQRALQLGEKAKRFKEGCGIFSAPFVVCCSLFFVVGFIRAVCCHLLFGGYVDNNSRHRGNQRNKRNDR